MKMRKLLLTALAMVAIACSKSDEVQMIDAPEGMGIVNFSVMPTLAVEGTRAQVNLPEGTTVPVGGDFALQILKNESTGYDGGTWVSVTTFNENYKKTYFVQGYYNAIVTYGNPSEEGVNKPFFKGDFSYNIIARQKTDITIPAKLANSIVKVEFSDRFKKYFENGANITISTENETDGVKNKWTVDYTSSPYIFVESGKKVTIAGTATKQRPSATVEPEVVTFSSVEKNLAPCTLYTYRYDVSTAGSVSVSITITNEPTETIVVSDGEEMNDDAIVN
jgi:hypothetical protein